MQTNLTLDEMILQYSENPFIDDETLCDPVTSNRKQKKQILSKLLLIASNLFEKYPERGLNSYKHRYEFK